MRKVLIIALFLAAMFCHAQTGTWRAYMAYSDVTEVEQAGNMVYVLASGGLFSYNQNDQSIQTYDKVNYLNDTEISHIKWCQAARRLVIVYTDYNIDLLDGGNNVTNLSDYYHKSMMEDKTVNHINIDGQYAYLSTAFGIIKLNVANAEISDTYQLGFNVSYSYIANGNIYAASAQNGTYEASLSSNLLDKSNWKRIGDFTPRDETTDEELLNKVKTLQPGGPKYNYFNYLCFANNKLYTSGGGWTTGSQYLRPGTVQVLSNEDEWQIYEEPTPLYDRKYLDATAIAVDPADEEHVFVGSCGTGIYEFKNGRFLNNYTYGNSELHSAVIQNGVENTEYVRTDGLIYDNDGNLWILNSESPNALISLSPTLQWETNNDNALFSSNGKSLGILKGSIIDSRGLIWFVNDHSGYPSLFSLNPKTKEVNNYHTFVNQDGSPLSIYNCRCVAEDISGNIWLGTNIGPLFIPNESIGNTSNGYTQVKVPRNDGTNYADYLLYGADISCMAVDGAGRKWFGTNENGVYLISEDNYTQIHHFTADNSKLLSDHVEGIAINQLTGEVFFGTDKGLCSYVSDATLPNQEMNKDNVYAYPNPVRPDYTGLITVTGLTLNAEVKITTTNGILVAEGRSNGGSFTWNGRSKKGKRVASGIYHVITATADGNKGTVCKIAVIN